MNFLREVLMCGVSRRECAIQIIQVDDGKKMQRDEDAMPVESSKAFADKLGSDCTEAIQLASRSAGLLCAARIATSSGSAPVSIFL